MIRYTEDNNKQMKELKWNTNPIKQWTGNGIGAEGAIQISESLKTNTTLTELNLYRDDTYSQDNNKQMKEMKWNTNPIKQWTGNQIGAEGAIAISESLKTNTTMTELNLGGDDKM